MGLISRVSSRTYRGATHTIMTVKLGFFEDFMLAGVAAGVSKTFAAPIERVKLLVQNQDEMIRQGRLDKPYTGVVDCTTRTLKTEGIIPFWRGNLANVLRYFPTQALNFAFKDTIKGMFATPKTAPQWKQFATNIASGGFTGSMSLTVVYSLDFARTRLANDAKGKGGERQFNGLIDVYKKTRLRRYRRSLPRLRDLVRRYLHLPRYVLWPLRLAQANGCRRGRLCHDLLLPRLGRHHRVRPHVLPNRYRPKAHDDDQWRCRQVQRFPRLRPDRHQERRFHVLDEGCRCQRPPRCCRCWCLGRLRRVQGRLHRLAIWLNLINGNGRIGKRLWTWTCVNSV